MNKTLPKTLTEFSQFAAKQFLQTAVFIDDNIYDRKTGTVSEPKALQKPAPTRKAALKSTEGTSSAKARAVADEPAQVDEYSPQDIVTSFAKKCIVCSLYQPKRDASVGQNSDAYQLCLASDIAIIDWDLYGDGRRALDLVANLIHQSLTDVPEQIRLVLIYTKETNLEAVASEVYDRLNQLLPAGVEPKEEDKGLALHTPNTRVVILGKPGRRPDKYQGYEVNERDIADRAVSEFSKLASGILQGAVLLGLAEIRQNSRKILTKFDSSLDPAFLTHRALLLRTGEDASGHVLPLLVAEIQSVLEDRLESPIISKDLIQDWCENHWQPASHAHSLAANKAREAAKRFCLENNLGSISKKDILGFLLPRQDSTANHRFAELLSQRTHYLATKRHLQLGTVLRDTGGRYFLCLQPVCDSVRLDEQRHFIFVQLRDKPTKGSDDSTNLIVFDSDAPKELWIEPKSYFVRTQEFEPTGRERLIVSVSQGDGSFTFKSCSGAEFIWVAQLRVEHAQREAEQFARQLSRVGLTESEWLRQKR